MEGETPRIGRPQRTRRWLTEAVLSRSHNSSRNASPLAFGVFSVWPQRNYWLVSLQASAVKIFPPILWIRPEKFPSGKGRSHPFQPNLIVDSVSEFLLAAQVSFRRLNGGVTQEKLNLLQLTSREMA